MQFNNSRSFKTLLPLLLLSTTTSLYAQQSAVASTTTQIVTTDSNTGATTTPWITVLKGTIDTTDSENGGLVMNTSAVTILSSEDSSINGSASLGIPAAVLLYEGIGIQARVLLDCNQSCDPSSDAVASKYLATPGVVTLDQTLHYMERIDLSSLSLAMNSTGGARSFNFFKTGVHNGKHTAQYQLRFMVDAGAYPLGATFKGVGAAVGPRTMVLTSLGVEVDR
jgi:hypothetical protein